VAKATVQWKSGDAWYEAKVKLSYTRNGNFSFKHDGKRYVLADLKNGAEILVLEQGKWMKAGRVAWGILFLGEGETYREHCDRQFAQEKALPTVVF
jgi:hypothetical protein